MSKPVYIYNYICELVFNSVEILTNVHSFDIFVIDFYNPAKFGSFVICRFFNLEISNSIKVILGLNFNFIKLKNILLFC